MSGTGKCVSPLPVTGDDTTVVTTNAADNALKLRTLFTSPLSPTKTPIEGNSGKLKQHKFSRNSTQLRLGASWPPMKNVKGNECAFFGSLGKEPEKYARTRPQLRRANRQHPSPAKRQPSRCVWHRVIAIQARFDAASAPSCQNASKIRGSCHM
jgi:hypothetical protein